MSGGFSFYTASRLEKNGRVVQLFGMREEPAFFRSVQLCEVTLRVRALERVAAFYREIVGLRMTRVNERRVELFAPEGGAALIVLEEAAEAKARPAGTAGLFHTAILFPSRAALGAKARRLIDLGVEFGTGDHGVSEALYLDDPEGNGVELYADRAPADWPRASDDGQVTMYTEAVEMRSLLAAGAGVADNDASAGARIGHVHLSVAELGAAETFFSDVLKFPIRQRSYPGALFFGRDGYHHHFGANVWRSRLPAAPEALGLARLTITFADSGDLAGVLAAAEAKGFPVAREAAGARLRTRDGIGFVVRVAEGS